MIISVITLQMNPNNDSPLANDDATSNSFRVVVAVLTTIGFLVFGYLFLSSMRARQWYSAVPAGIAALTMIPWASHKTAARDCATGSLCTGVGSVCAVGTIFLYFALFDLEWFSGIFNHKDAGPLGMIIFAAIGFFSGACFTYRILLTLSFPTKSS